MFVRSTRTAKNFQKMLLFLLLCSPSAFGERWLTVAEHFVLFWGLFGLNGRSCSLNVVRCRSCNLSYLAAQCDPRWDGYKFNWQAQRDQGRPNKQSTA